MLKITSYIFSLFLFAHSAQAEVIDNPFKRTCSGLTSKKMQEYMDKKRPEHIKKYSQAGGARKSVETQNEYLNDFKKIKKDICESQELLKAKESLKNLTNLKLPPGNADCSAYDKIIQAQEETSKKLNDAQAFLQKKKGNVNSDKQLQGSFTHLNDKRFKESTDAINQMKESLDNPTISKLSKETENIFSKRENKEEESFFMARYKEMEQDISDTKSKLNEVKNRQLELKSIAKKSGLNCNFTDDLKIGPQ